MHNTLVDFVDEFNMTIYFRNSVNIFFSIMRVIVFISDVNLIHKTFVCLRRFLLVDTGLPDHHCTVLLSGHGINFTYIIVTGD